MGLSSYPRTRNGKAAATIDRGEVGNQSRCAAVADRLRATESLSIVASIKRILLFFSSVSVFFELIHSTPLHHHQRGSCSYNGPRFVYPSSSLPASHLYHHRSSFTTTNTPQSPSQAQSPALPPPPHTSTPNTTSQKIFAASSGNAQTNELSTRTPPAGASRSGTSSKRKSTASRPMQKLSGAARAVTRGPRRMRMPVAMDSLCCNRVCSLASWWRSI